VFEKLVILNIETEQILMSPNSFFKVQTNRDRVASLSYRILDDQDRIPVVQIDERGLLHSGSLIGLATVEVIGQEPFGINQTLIVAVKVAPVSYLRISMSPVLHTKTNEVLEALPLGTTMTLTIHFHDNSGDIFHSQNSVVSFATNRDDFIQVGKGVSNNTLIIRTMNVGLTVLMVWDAEHSNIADYVPLLVQHVIYPELRDIVVGDVICFSSSLVNQEGLSGMWSSSLNGVLQIDPKTGVAVARNSGTVTIYYEIPGLFKTYREVLVNVPQRIVAIYISGTKTSLEGISSSKVIVKIGHSSRNMKGECLLAQIEVIEEMKPQSSISCHLHFNTDLFDCQASEIFIVEPGFDAVSEQISAEVPFNPGFYANETEIILSNHYPSSDVKIFGATEILQNLEVKSGSPMVVISEKDRSYGLPSYITYTVRLSDPRLSSKGSLSTMLTITSRVTDQSFTIPVTMIYVSDRTMSMKYGASLFHHFIDSYQILFFTLFALLAGTAVMIIVHCAIFSPKEQKTHPAFTPRRSPQHRPNGIEFPVPSAVAFSPIPSNRENNSPTRLWSPHYASQ
ncbi:UNVERIFIED_CONTAM: hypothetical protein K2H54_047229, partial [Gekko kuhli]